MIILDAATKSLEAVLAGAVTTTQLAIVAAFVDVTTTTYIPGASDTATNNTTGVTVVAAPAAATQRQIKLLTVYNADTVVVTVTLRLNNTGTLRPLIKVTLAVGSTLVYTDGEGFRVITATGEIVGTGGSVTVSPGGSDTQVQFKDGTTFGGDAGLTYNKTTDELTIAGDLNVGGGDLIGTANLVIRRNTADGSDAGWTELTGGGAGGVGSGSQDRSGYVRLHGNEYSGAGGNVQLGLGNVSGSKLQVINAAGGEAIGVLGSTGSATFTSTQSSTSAWAFNGSGGQPVLTVRTVGTDVISVATGKLVNGTYQDTDGAIVAWGTRLYLLAVGGQIRMESAAVHFANINTTANAANCWLDSGDGNRIYRSTSLRTTKADVAALTLADARALLRLIAVRYHSRNEHDDPAREYWGFIAENAAVAAPSFAASEHYDTAAILAALTRLVQEHERQLARR